ncbi:indolepyruvate ferredoxin oxidoreductase subunit alpha [Desulfurispirillum indicum]|uniref:indolepyruvate ferredoxin oxidoreductase subunit alpha n=1 Tax=Desulfurispirillum indicum TaxID=936456 RepID=UPI001CFC1CCF|nr:indolepyruvate ferredoxin oxidoreductase subunit alpha [Desulfurispirillum indicum]UCZ57343.1 indolepyruvate ferredoxin oxidoreductase subunit alpha [Desulfurispirillum indicum]
MTSQPTQSKTMLLSGNEAIALAARDAGVALAAGYPGTPSTEIIENIAKNGGLYCEWAPNEKVALEVCIGASFAGARTLCTTKHVGLNVAADPLFTAAYTGVRGGLVIICADDPGMHSSQNEQDSRHYARAAKILMLEPSDPNEAYHYTRAAFELSEQFDIPVLVRTTTRINHGKGVVKLSSPADLGERTYSTEYNPLKYVMIPAYARMRHEVLEASLLRMAEHGNTSGLNQWKRGEKKIGIITSGVSHSYVQEVVPAEWSILKLGTTHPLPEKLIEDFCRSVDEVIVVEELEPYLEHTVKRLGFACKGKELFGITGELNPDRVARGLGLATGTSDVPAHKLPPRPPVLCPGCPHRGSFTVMKRLGLFVSGDIGCYTLGVNKPLDSIHTCVCMGASIGVAHGMDRVLPEEERRKVVAVIGDSTFLHTGINGLINMVYNRSTSTVFILDNRITAMTGQQGNPGYGNTLMGEPTSNVDMEGLCRAIGIKHVYKADAFDTPALFTLANREVNRDELSVIIVERECVLAFKDIIKPALHVDIKECIGCGACLNVGCPALVWNASLKVVTIDTTMCTGCEICMYECPTDAIKKPENK